MNKRDILKLQKESNQITSEEDISITDDMVLDLCRKIFIHNYGKAYVAMDFSLYQTGPYKHALYPNLVVNPHFVRDDGVIIYLELVQTGVLLKTINENTVQMSMEILKSKNATVFTIYLNDGIDIKSGIDVDISNCFGKITERDYVYDAEIVKNYIASTTKKKIKISGTSNTSNFLEPIQGFIRTEWVSASKTRNYALRDTLIDWLDCWYDKTNGTITDKPFNTFNNSITNSEYSFSKFLMGKGVEFESQVIKLIKKKVEPHEFVTICSSMVDYDKKILTYEKNSIDEIMKGTPVIYQPVLMNRVGELAYTYGMPDLLVRSDYLDKIIKKNPLGQTKLNGSYHYVVVDIKFSTLELCADGKRIRNSGSVPAYKCQLYIYNHALGKIQGYEPTESYILGRKYKYVSKGTTYSDNNCFSKFGHIEYQAWDNKYVQETIAAVNWIKNLRKNGKEWKLLPQPTVPELYPNMTSQFETLWRDIKSDYANKIGEITLLWNCGVKNRQIAHANKIFSFNDPKCCAKNIGVNGPRQRPVLDEIIKINKRKIFDNVMDNIHLNLNQSVNNSWLTPSKLLISVDFENISNIFDDFKNLPIASDNNYLFLIGVGYCVTTTTTDGIGNSTNIIYKMFIISELTKNAEFQLIHQFYTFLRSITDQYLGPKEKIPLLYHWGHAERTYFSGLCDKLLKLIGQDIKTDIQLMKNNLYWFDLSECFKNNPIVINGCFKFGLKEIAKRLNKLGLITTEWNTNSSCSNGNTAMIMAQKAYMTSQQTGICITQSPIMQEIIAYNKIDCVVLHEIIRVLRNKVDYDRQLGSPPNKKQKINL